MKVERIRMHVNSDISNIYLSISFLFSKASFPCATKRASFSPRFSANPGGEQEKTYGFGGLPPPCGQTVPSRGRHGNNGYARLRGALPRSPRRRATPPPSPPPESQRAPTAANARPVAIRHAPHRKVGSAAAPVLPRRESVAGLRPGGRAGTNREPRPPRIEAAAGGGLGRLAQGRGGRDCRWRSPGSGAFGATSALTPLPPPPI